MTKEFKIKISNFLENLGEDILTSTGCTWWWGEEELPEPLKAELEAKMES